jgi:hypothetical protein
LPSWPSGGLAWVREWRSGRRRFLTPAGVASLTACAAVPDLGDYLRREGAAEPVDATGADICNVIVLCSRRYPLVHR